ncbi:MAG: potassium channel family protein [Dehalococcoidia bacterium]
MTRLEAFERQTDLPMLVLSGVFLVLIVLPWVWPGAAEHERLLLSLEWIIWGVFAAEFGVRVALAPRRLRYVAAHWYDLAIVVLPFLRPLRLARGLKAVALLVRFVGTWRRALLPRGAHHVALLAGGSIAAAAVGAWRAERTAEGSSIADLADALWWAVTTVTTVGYGDTFPTTPAGRGIGVMLMIVGIALFGVITANVAAYFVHEDDAAHDSEVLAALRRIEERLDRLEARRAPDGDA